MNDAIHTNPIPIERDPRLKPLMDLIAQYNDMQIVQGTNKLISIIGNLNPLSNNGIVIVYLCRNKVLFWKFSYMVRDPEDPREIHYVIEHLNRRAIGEIAMAGLQHLYESAEKHQTERNAQRKQPKTQNHE